MQPLLQLLKRATCDVGAEVAAEAANRNSNINIIAQRRDTVPRRRR
jgi:hypothetical protein